jgi:hypothetical protein
MINFLPKADEQYNEKNMERNSEIFSGSPYRNVLKETKKVRRKQSEKYSKSKRRKRRSEPSSSGSSCSVTRKIFAIQDTTNCTGCGEVYRVYNRRLDQV